MGGGAPFVFQSMTMTDTAGRGRAQCIELSEAGRDGPVTVSVPKPRRRFEIKRGARRASTLRSWRLHYNCHLLTRFPECAQARSTHHPCNVGRAAARLAFADHCVVAPIGTSRRIGVNGGSLNQELVVAKMQENTDRELGRSSEDIINECMVLSAVQSTELALESGLRRDQIIISCKTSRPRDLIAVYRELSRKTDQPLHLGLTEAGMGTKGLVWSSAAMGILLSEGIGDTIRVSLTRGRAEIGARKSTAASSCRPLACDPFPPASLPVPVVDGDEQHLQELAERTQAYIRERMPE